MDANTYMTGNSVCRRCSITPPCSAGGHNAARDTLSLRQPLGTLVRVLVVEDHSDSLDSLIRYLALCGYEIVGVLDAESGLALHASNPFDAVLTDINLAGMSGCELARALRKLGGATPHLDAMSGVPLDPADRDLFEHFFLKPVSLKHLASTLARY